MPKSFSTKSTVIANFQTLKAQLILNKNTTKKKGRLPTKHMHIESKFSNISKFIET